VRTVLTNAGPLIALGKLDRLVLLQRLYPSLAIPQAVYQEVVVAGLAREAPDALAVRLFVDRFHRPIIEASEAVLASYAPAVELDAGERELLALARSAPEPLVLLDDEMARGEARRLAIAAKGTLGVLVEAYRSGLLPFDELKLLLLTIGKRPDLWISEKLCRQVLAALAET
jgi:predicted nucleic acid-binding protein